jgi:AcrR family transcriptional regulator
MPAEPRVGDQRPGGRAARVRAAVLEATSAVLDERGYERLTVEEIATRAGVHKTTIYRRWPTKALLVEAAALAHAEQNIPIPDTGTLLGDLQALGRAVAATIGAEIGARRSRSIVAAAAASSAVATSLNAFWTERLSLARPIVERAIARGEIPASTDPNLVIEALVGPLWMRLLLTGGPIDNEVADQLATLIATGARRP